LQLIVRNFRHRRGEIDLIMASPSPLATQVLVFVEVRYRRSRRYGGSAASVTPDKQRRIALAAQSFRQRHQHYARWPCRFDVVTLQGTISHPQINWLRNAFAAF